MRLPARLVVLALVCAALVPGAGIGAQVVPGPAPERPSPAVAPEVRRPGPADIIMPHITDGKDIEFPCIHGWGEWACHVTLPTWNVTIAGRTIDMAPTRHVVFMMLAALLSAGMLIFTARAHRRHSHEVGRPRGFAAGLEGVILFLRNQVYMPVLGPGGQRYVPFVLTLFFFILFCNVLGLVPYGATATGNIAVTATLAIITFFVVEAAGMRALGKGYLGTIVYWPHGMSVWMKIPLSIILTPVELIGKFTKPFALAIRLFANMTAGHVIVLALIGLIFTFGIYVFWAPFAMALGIMLLEIFIAFLQAFVFALLAAVFIGQIREAAH